MASSPTCVRRDEADLRSSVHPPLQLIPARQRITLDKTAFVDDEKTLDDYGVKEGDSLFVKDLGPQISWRTVFLVEYVSPPSSYRFFLREIHRHPCSTQGVVTSQNQVV